MHSNAIGHLAVGQIFACLCCTAIVLSQCGYLLVLLLCMWPVYLYCELS